MTAEIGIMNRFAIALASDSAVTIGVDGKEKTINHANKLFSLSKYHPIGIMIYGDADFMGIPWEVIIKMYRKKLGNRKYNTLKQYSDDFINFIKSEKSFLKKSNYKYYFLEKVNNYLSLILDELGKKIKNQYDDSNFTELEIAKIIKNEMRNKLKKIQKIEFSYEFNESDVEEIIRIYKTDIHNIINDLIYVKLTKSTVRCLENICANVLVRQIYINGYTGIVISGFGEEEIFPGLYEYKVEGIIQNKLKYSLNNKTCIGYEENQSIASIIPFAQQEMVHLFMDGIDPYLKTNIFNTLYGIFSNFSNTISKVFEIKNINKKLTKSDKKLINEAGNELFKEICSNFVKEQEEVHQDPVMNMISILPKEELATVAETLINITSFKRKVTFDTETVGGPIDVAVISKGDGFIWIKRKHYFKPEYNHMFFKNYLRNDE